jgi:hypothetical protein
MGRNGTVQLRVVGEPPRPPRRQRNIDRRPREYLTPAEVETLIATARKRSRLRPPRCHNDPHRL